MVSIQCSLFNYIRLKNLVNCKLTKYACFKNLKPDIVSNINSCFQMWSIMTNENNEKCFQLFLFFFFFHLKLNDCAAAANELYCFKLRVLFLSMYSSLF